MAQSKIKLEQAEQRMTDLRASGYAVSARYDRRKSRIVVDLNSGVQFAFPTQLAEGLSNASPESLADIEISPSGLGLHWPKLDADVYIPAILQGVFGSKTWMAQQLGAKGGRARSDAKVSASRENGRRGGRPRKSTAA
ncbi:DUF2442 domain-containing protein [uncultured Rhodoblastus sp.]|uniref:DUF2442 domain-containing protein n=1 Tax=uncultured Rhodoblastus sp. TaxID=543037 RepID=UPI0025E84EEF|nr:DUF2442 domain-containing protein [uncultured Rhodoblastus sp.]